MNQTDPNVMTMNTETAANDLTQLSSREQLSALMDGALPPDQTRFLLRRLQHDASLAECWERWRLSAEVMRGLAPAQRLPADFASRVSAALHGDDVDVVVAQQAGSKRTPAWLRWGGGAAMAASLVVALMTRQPVAEAPAAPASVQLASASAPALEIPATPVPQAPSAPDTGNAAQALATAGAIAAVSTTRPARGRGIEQTRTPTRVQAVTPRDVAVAQIAATDAGLLPTHTAIQPDIVTRPWPRSVLPQYASGGLNVGFGDHARGAAAYNPFQPQAGIGSLPPINTNAADDAAAPRPANIEPQP